MTTTDTDPIGLPSTEQLDMMPAPACMRDSAGLFVTVNQRFEATFDLSAGDVVGRFPSEVFDVCPASMVDPAEPGALEAEDAYEVVFIGSVHRTHRVVRQASWPTAGPGGAGPVIELFTTVSATHVPADVEAAHRAERDELRNLVNSDALTGAASRRAFEAVMPDLLTPNGGGLIVVDLDHFKGFNDRYGHSAGDAALVHFVRIVRRILRDGDLVARLGGEEFTIVVPGTSMAESSTIAERIRSEAEENPVDFDDAALPFTVSVGVRHVSAKEDVDLAGWVADADQLLYKAKSLGRNRVASLDDLADLASNTSAMDSFSAVRRDGPLKMAELQAAAQLLRLVLDHIPQAVFWKDRESVYLGCNANFAHRAGLSDPNDIVGLDDFQMPWCDSDADGFVEWDRRIVESGRPELGIVEQVLEADGAVTWARTSKLPLFDAEGTVVGILGTFEDITAEKTNTRPEDPSP